MIDNLQKRINHTPRQHQTSADRRLQEALAKRERYLARHPHLRIHQAEIDRMLDKSGNVQGRLAVIGTLMQGKLIEMQGEFYKLNRLLQKASS
jgi:hypothetical protein